MITMLQCLSTGCAFGQPLNEKFFKSELTCLQSQPQTCLQKKHKEKFIASGINFQQLFNVSQPQLAGSAQGRASKLWSKSKREDANV